MQKMVNALKNQNCIITKADIGCVKCINNYYAKNRICIKNNLI